ncbi:MAG: prepilin peptidase [Candidatus Omnitrophica bacterium]|nr:prepilin peptidase [Candidatus Omnitrophota bacterium]MCK5179982.1 prepilin peptidase [Candidatus Omnitrophota bacterium]
MYIFYPIIIGLGFFTSYTDIKSGKIRNKHLLFASVLGLIVYICLIITKSYTFNINHFSNILFGTGIGLLLYFTKTWGAGDAKLFAVFCLLMPTERYSHFFPFTSIVIFINIFLLSTFTMLFLSITRLFKARIETVQMFKKFFSISTINLLIISLLTVVCLGWIVPPVIRIILPGVSGFICVIVLYFCYHIMYAFVDSLVKNYVVAFMVASSGLLARFYFHNINSIGTNPLNSIKITFCYTIFFHYLRIILTSNNEDAKNIPFAPLIFLGTLLTNTNFLNLVLNTLRSIR